MSTPSSSDGAALIDVSHETLYRYAGPVELALHVAHLRPLDDARQSLLSFDMQVEPAPSHHACAIDAFGNARSFMSLDHPHDTLRVHSRSRVRVLPGAPVNADQPWEAASLSRRARAAPVCDPGVALFAVPSARTPSSPALREYVLASFTPQRPLGEAATDFMHRIHAEFRYEPASTEVNTPMLEAFAQRRGVCQDFAHVMLAGLRSLGLAARYVSGYVLTHPAPGAPALVGADASHAWVALACAQPGGGTRWLELDPTNDCVAGISHVRLASGRDYGDVTPLRGVIRAGGGHTLEVRVHTARAAEGAAHLTGTISA
ncbi:MAG TPA: transglutaminase family protein [Burkholderiaceae bacterium]|jgi:transglutaminase-like putative cysteine protease|nr:transglutaminase family protein [Burkholderiaceae bacterium]